VFLKAPACAGLFLDWAWPEGQTGGGIAFLQEPAMHEWIAALSAVAAVTAVAALASSAPAAGVSGIVLDTDRSVNCATYKTIAQDVTAGCRTDQEKAVAVFNFVVRTVWIPFDYDRPKEMVGGRLQTVYDPLKIINIYGAGGCGIQQGVFASLLKAAGLEERALSPGFAHVSNEVKWAGKWHWLDTWLPLYLTDEKGDIYSYDELMADRSLITKAVAAGRHAKNFMFNPEPDAKALLSAKGHSAGGSGARPQQYVENLTLRPGESCTWLWDNAGKWYWPEEKYPQGGPAFKFNAEARCQEAFPYWEPYKKSIQGGPHPWSEVYYRYYGNAVFVAAPPLTRPGLADLEAKLTNVAFVEGGGIKPQKDGPCVIELAFDLPYTIADTEIEGSCQVASGAAVKIEFSLDDGKTWKEGKAISESGRFGPVSIGRPNSVEFPAGTTSGQYRFRLRLTLASDKAAGAALKTLKVTNTTMLNFYSRPWLETGKNKVVVTAANAEALARTPLEITWRWLEDWKDEKSFTHKVAGSGEECTIEVGGSKRPKMKSVTISCPPK
jgi:hypothetical protein